MPWSRRRTIDERGQPRVLLDPVAVSRAGGWGAEAGARRIVTSPASAAGAVGIGRPAVLAHPIIQSIHQATAAPASNDCQYLTPLARNASSILTELPHPIGHEERTDFSWVFELLVQLKEKIDWSMIFNLLLVIFRNIEFF